MGVLHVRDLAMALGKYVMSKDLEKRGKLFEELPASHDLYHRWRARELSSGKLVGEESHEGGHTVKAHFAAMTIQDNWKTRGTSPKGPGEEGGGGDGSAKVACDAPESPSKEASNGEQSDQKAA